MVKEIWRLIVPRKFVFPEGFAWGKFDFSKSFYVYSRTFMQYTIYFTKQHTILQNTSIITGFSTLRKQKRRERLIFSFLQLWIFNLFFVIKRELK